MRRMKIRTTPNFGGSVSRKNTESRASTLASGAAPASTTAPPPSTTSSTTTLSQSATNPPPISASPQITTTNSVSSPAPNSVPPCSPAAALTGSRPPSPCGPPPAAAALTGSRPPSPCGPPPPAAATPNLPLDAVPPSSVSPPPPRPSPPISPASPNPRPSPPLTPTTVPTPPAATAPSPPLPAESPPVTCPASPAAPTIPSRFTSSVITRQIEDNCSSDDSSGNKENSSHLLSDSKPQKKEFIAKEKRSSTVKKLRASSPPPSKLSPLQAVRSISPAAVARKKSLKVAKIKMEGGASEVMEDAKKAVYRERKEEYRKKISKGLERSHMTMFDLIFYNPASNPMPGQNEAATKKRDRLTSKSDTESISSERVEEERVDDVGLDSDNVVLPQESPKEPSVPEDAQKTPDGSDGECSEVVEVSRSEDMFAPRVKIGPDGKIIVDEQSIKIQTTAAKNRDEILSKAEVVEEVNDSSHYGKWSKRRRRSNLWTIGETARFYKALSTVGTDFSLMQTLLCWRSRAELKAKFKKEERDHRELVDRALRDKTQFDVSLFDEEGDFNPEEDRKAARLAERAEAKRRRMEMKQADKEKENQRKKAVKQKERAESKKHKQKLKAAYRSKKKKKKGVDDEQYSCDEGSPGPSAASSLSDTDSLHDTVSTTKKRRITATRRRRPERRNSLVISEVTVTMETVKYESHHGSSTPAVVVEHMLEDGQKNKRMVEHTVKEDVVEHTVEEDVVEHTVEEDVVEHTVEEDMVEHTVEEDSGEEVEECVLVSPQPDPHSPQARKEPSHHPVQGPAVEAGTEDVSGGCEPDSSRVEEAQDQQDVVELVGVDVPEMMQVSSDGDQVENIAGPAHPQLLSSEDSKEAADPYIGATLASPESTAEVYVSPVPAATENKKIEESAEACMDVSVTASENIAEAESNAEVITGASHPASDSSAAICISASPSSEEKGVVGISGGASSLENNVSAPVSPTVSNVGGSTANFPGPSDSDSTASSSVAVNEQKIWHFPVTAIKTREDGTRVLVVPTCSGNYSVPVPPLPPGTSNVVVVVVPSGEKEPQHPDNNLYHVYALSPIDPPTS